MSHPGIISNGHDNIISTDTMSRNNYSFRCGSTTQDNNKPVPFLNMRDNSRRHSQFYKYSKIGEYGMNKQHQMKYNRNSIDIDSEAK